MANTPQARKRVRQAEKKRQHNASLRSRSRTMIKKAVKSIYAASLEEAQIAYKQMVPIIDRAATKGIMTSNKVARHKSRLMSKLRKLG